MKATNTLSKLAKAKPAKKQVKAVKVTMGKKPKYKVGKKAKKQSK